MAWSRVSSASCNSWLIRSNSPTSLALTRVNLCTSQLANHPSAKATNRMIAVVMTNSVLLIGSLFAGVVGIGFLRVRFCHAFGHAVEGAFGCRRGRFRADQAELDPAVFLAAFFGVVFRDGAFLAIPARD